MFQNFFTDQGVCSEAPDRDCSSEIPVRASKLLKSLEIQSSLLELEDRNRNSELRMEQPCCPQCPPGVDGTEATLSTAWSHAPEFQASELFQSVLPFLSSNVVCKSSRKFPV